MQFSIKRVVSDFDTCEPECKNLKERQQMSQFELENHNCCIMGRALSRHTYAKVISSRKWVVKWLTIQNVHMHTHVCMDDKKWRKILKY